jgi:DNA topoisomerase-1
MNKLIVAEKPSVALRIAMALGESSPQSQNVAGIRYFVIRRGDDTIYITAAAGHLFTLTQKGASTVPVFDIEWVPSYKVNQSAYFTKKYLDAIESVARQCAFFINACDYDLEGTVIGTNIIKYVVNRNVNSQLGAQSVRRMRFSTTTNADLIESYANLNEFDSLNFDAGETRHMLDWMWGINLSRALMRAISTKGIRKTLSIGRVQGPTLGILAKREKDIKGFVSRPYWKIAITAKGTDFEAAKDKEIFDKQAADSMLHKAKSASIVISSVQAEERNIRPFPPFDLTSLQIEASRAFHIDPSKTLAIAQSLYEKSYISYPRTSSQKLPPTLNLPRLITAMSKIADYSDMASDLIKSSRFRPAEGMKEDEAHPAIHPTGEQPRSLSDEERKIYDMIARRFLSCFAQYAKAESRKVAMDVAGTEYRAAGEKVTYRGWLDFYRYYSPKEAQIPDFTKGEAIKPDKIDMKALKTLPPKRFTKASLISLLESKDLGTKATRAEVIDTLFRRDYIKGGSIEVSEFGLSVYDALSTYCADIISEDLTRKLEKDMEKIQQGKAAKAEVVDEGKRIITGLVGEFHGKEAQIGEALMKGLKESENTNVLGPCTCGGTLVLRRSKAGKNFVGCSNWPKCTKTYSVPQSARIVSTGKVCELCHTPIVKVFRKGKGVFQMDLDPSCETKKNWGKPREQPDMIAGAKAVASVYPKAPQAASAPQQKAQHAPAQPPAVPESQGAKKPKPAKRSGAAKKPSKGKKPGKKQKEQASGK